MKTPRPSNRSHRAFTLLEMTVVILVLLALMKIGMLTSSKMNDWKLARNASETLRGVYSAQRMFLADNPTVAPAAITEALILPYMASTATGAPVALPTVKSLTGATLGILVNVSPPRHQCRCWRPLRPIRQQQGLPLGRWGIMRILVSILLIAVAPVVSATEFKHVGDFLLQAQYKLTGQAKTPIPMKPIAFRVFTDGVRIRVTTEGDEDAHSTFEIYRSDGIGRQRQGSGALEVIPGLQAMSNVGGTLRHLRLSRESMTITTFPGVSDQTIVSYAVAAEPKIETARAEEKILTNP